MVDTGTTPPKATKNRGGKKKPSTTAKKDTPPNKGTTPNYTEWPEDKALPANIACRGFDQIMAKFLGTHQTVGFRATANEIIAYRQSLERQQAGQNRGRGANA